MSDKQTVLEADGASVRPETLIKENFFRVTDFGASATETPKANTLIINKTIEEAAAAGGGTVVIPKGTFLTYTILLKSNVNLFLEEGAVIAAAKADISQPWTTQKGEGGNYEEPEVNLYAGLQDHGHSYFANSLLYGADLENIMIYGKGLFTGGRMDEETGILEYVLQGGDPPNPMHRSDKGHLGEWFGNKGIALVRCKNIVLRDFAVTIGGHFAVIAEGCTNLYADRILIDTTRDAFDIDCCQNVTVRNTTCNSLTDDGLCLKASFGAGRYMPTQNVLIEDCTVSGYDAGSVYAEEYTGDKLIAEDRCGPTGRVKLGTESTCGYHQVTIRRVKFDRSRGFALEAVDCSSLTDVLFEDCLLDNVSSSPIFIRAGDRGRFPVTGIDSGDELMTADNVRLDNRDWVLPGAENYLSYPPQRYAPHYNRTRTVTVDGHSFFEIIEQENPVTCNAANLTGDIAGRDKPLYANAIGCADMAKVENICIRNVRITNVDPRYPILLMGLTDSHLKNITLENIEVEYRGGITMEHAVEQRQLNTDWKFSQFHAREHVQSLPWLVNTFFLKHEGLLPRAEWDPAADSWVDDPYNVPELPEVYPEPSNWGILPAYGLFAKHVDDLTLRNVKISCKVPDGRHVCVLDDVKGVRIDGLEAYCDPALAPIVTVTDHFRRHTNAENVPEQPYFTTAVEGLKIDPSIPVAQVEINAPAPGTPSDSLYPYPTVPCKETGYRYKVDTDAYPLPLTVYRPYIKSMGVQKIRVGETCTLNLQVRCPAADVSDEPYNGIVYGQQMPLHHSVKGAKTDLRLSVEGMPAGASFDVEKRLFCWCPDASQTGNHEVTFIVDDGIIPEKMTIRFTIEQTG